MSRPHRIRRNSMDDDDTTSDEDYDPSRSSHRPARRKAALHLHRGSTGNSSSNGMHQHHPQTSAHRLEAARPIVQHHYHDHSRDPVQILDDTANKNDKSNDNVRTSKPRGGVTVAFPEKLHDMLATLMAEGREDVISWQPHGRCFLVYDKKEFVEHVMPRFFHQSKLTSFQRQLNLYGFVRLTAGRDRGGYYHELFLRGRPDLCRQISRTRIKGNGMKAASSPHTEPNFYNMTYCFEKQQHAEQQQQLAQQSDDMDVTCNSSRHPYMDLLSSSTNINNNSNATTSTIVPQDGVYDSPGSKVVSPPATPNILPNSYHHQVPALVSDMTWTAGGLGGGGEDIALPMPTTTTTSTYTPPQTGDVAFFEGHKFRYLEHYDSVDAIGTWEDSASVTCV